jgi:hypothetical protein
VPASLTALTEAAQARDALAQAPSLTPPGHPFIPASRTSAEVTDSIATMALALTQVLVAAAENSANESDKVACLAAALHTGRLHEALR